jgi:hypothetical protein
MKLAARRLSVPAILLAAAATTVLAVATSGANATHPARAHDHAPAAGAMTAREAVLHDAMRKLWEDHVTWTRLAIVSFAAGLPDLPAAQARLLRNQVDIGDAIKPYYGAGAGNRLTGLLKEHITGAVTLLRAAKSGDQARIAAAGTAWYANGDDVADFLSAANPRHWPRTAMRAMMKTHLDQTLKEAQDRLQGRYDADVRDYDAVHRHILEMSDALTAGIVDQFPKRFR